MTETLTATRTLPGVTIRAYRPADHNACRRLWAQLVQHRNHLYGTPGGDGDAGAGFEEYLTQLNLSGMWVAEHDRAVAGFIGLMLDGRTGEVDPVVVAEPMRGRGIGRALLSRVADEARGRGLRRLTVSPPVRDVAALHSLHAAGFGTVATVTLAYDFGGADQRKHSGGADQRKQSGGADQRSHSGSTTRSGTSAGEGEGLDLHDLRFSV